MANERRLGLAMPPQASGPIAQTATMAREAESLGYSSLWVPEVSGPDAFVTLAAFALNTSTADLATGVIPIQIRTPGVMGMGFASINELSGGRAIAGLGVSSSVIVERWHGATYQKPVQAMRECVTIMRQLMTEGRSKFAGEVYKSDFRMTVRLTQKRPARIYLAGLNAPMLQLAGEVADGVLMNYSPPDAMAGYIREIHKGALKAGRKPEDVDIGIYIRMCVTEDEAAAVDAFKRELAGYAFVDSYIKMFTRYGLGEELAEVRKLWQAGKRDEAPRSISDASARKIAAFGSAENTGKFVAAFRAAGVTHPVIFPIGPGATFARDYLNTMRAMTRA